MAFGSTDTSASALGSGAGGLVGLAGGIYTAIQGSELASQAAGIQKSMIQTQMAEETQKKQAMELSARRQMLQNVRSTQMARSMSLSTAVGQGAQFSSSATAGQGNALSSGNLNTQGINQNLQIGENLFNLNQEMDTEKMSLAGVQSQEATNSALGGVFGSLGKMGGPIGNLVGMIPFG